MTAARAAGRPGLTRILSSVWRPDICRCPAGGETDPIADCHLAINGLIRDWLIELDAHRPTDGRPGLKQGAVKDDKVTGYDNVFE